MGYTLYLLYMYILTTKHEIFMFCSENMLPLAKQFKIAKYTKYV